MGKELIRLTLRDRIRGVLDVTDRKAWGSLGAWLPIIRERYTGAWQSNVTVSPTLVASNWAVFACVTLIANDIGKMPAFVMRLLDNGIWQKIPFARKPLDVPNNYQLWPDFVHSWLYSLLLTGNTYILRVLNSKGHVESLYVLDPCSVQPLVTPSGEVYYQVSADNLSGVKEAITIPASQIIHDRINTLYHPLRGISPLWACGIAAMQGLAMQDNSTQFFQNMSMPGGILTAPGHISEQSAAALKEYWETNFSGENAGKVAVVGDGLKYERMAMSASDSQLIEQLKFTGEMICAAFHVPPYKIGLGNPPSVGNLAALNQQYYDQCLHPLVEAMERRLDIGLEVAPDQIWFDTEELLRMDPSARWDSYTKAVGAGVMAPNEARKKEQLVPVKGGDAPYMQQQNYSLEDLAFRSDKARENEDDGTDVQSLAMNGAQVSSLLSLVTSAANGEIPIESAKAAIKAAFPSLDDAEFNALIDPLKNFEPVTPEPTTPSTAPSTPPEPDADDADEEKVLDNLYRRLMEIAV